jgi:hypothetical protein
MGDYLFFRQKLLVQNSYSKGVEAGKKGRNDYSSKK